MRMANKLGILLLAGLFLLQCSSGEKKAQIIKLNEAWQSAVGDIQEVEGAIDQLKQEWKDTYDKMKLDDGARQALSIPKSNELIFLTDQYMAIGGDIKRLEDNHNAYLNGIKAQAASFNDLTQRYSNNERVLSLEVRVRKADEDISKVRAAKKGYIDRIEQLKTLYQDQFDMFQEKLNSKES